MVRSERIELPILFSLHAILARSGEVLGQIARWLAIKIDHSPARPFDTHLASSSGIGGLRSAGIEPATPSLGNLCSIQLSYERVR